MYKIVFCYLNLLFAIEGLIFHRHQNFFVSKLKINDQFVIKLFLNITYIKKTKFALFSKKN